MLREFVPRVEKEIKHIKANGIKIELDGELIKAVCEDATLSMLDGKMVTALLQLGGAYCTMCVRSQDECHQEKVVDEGFIIDRSIESLSDLALSLIDPDTEDITKKKNDYKVRQCLCGLPITESDITKTIPVCHSKIRSFEWVIELLTRYLSHKKWWSQRNKVKYTDEEKEMYKTARELLKAKLYDTLAINIGNPGDMVTGKAFHQFSSDHAREFICSLLKEEDQQIFKDILLRLCAAVKVINSQKRKVNIEKLRAITQEAYKKLVLHFPWVAISPSVHRILGHSWEVVLLNNKFGLGNISEEGLESLNKYIRDFRRSGARKDNTFNNFVDTFHHMWDRSRPTICALERNIKKRKDKVMISTEIEALVDSLFEEDDIEDL